MSWDGLARKHRIFHNEEKEKGHSKIRYSKRRGQHGTATFFGSDPLFANDLAECVGQPIAFAVLEQRLETLQRELDAAILAASHARTEKQQPKAGKEAAELRVEEMIKELENTTNFKEVREDENEEDVEE
ncbi:hypothetical protein Tco_0665817 [Tanacetum coccineum]